VEMRRQSHDLVSWKSSAGNRILDFCGYDGADTNIHN